MIEREPFLIRNGMRIFSVAVLVGLIALIVIGIRFQIENAEFANEERRFRTRIPNQVEFSASCDFFSGQFVGMPALPPNSPAPSLVEVCNLGGTALARIQCEHFEGVWGRDSCSIDVGQALQAIPRQPG